MSDVRRGSAPWLQNRNLRTETRVFTNTQAITHGQRPAGTRINVTVLRSNDQPTGTRHVRALVDRTGELERQESLKSSDSRSRNGTAFSLIYEFQKRACARRVPACARRVPPLFPHFIHSFTTWPTTTPDESPKCADHPYVKRLPASIPTPTERLGRFQSTTIKRLGSPTRKP